jgi:hypothetical protein
MCWQSTSFLSTHTNPDQNNPTKINMNSLNRRSFIKRTGGATLGTALGLGLIPSVTNRLRAADTSTTGVKCNTSPPPPASGSPPPAPVISTSSPALAYAGGQITTGLDVTVPPTNSCVSSLRIDYSRWIRFDYPGRAPQIMTETWSITWACVGGVPTASKSPPVTTPASGRLHFSTPEGSGSLEFGAVSGTSDSTDGAAGGATDGFGDWIRPPGAAATGSPISAPNVTVEVVCC